VRESKRINVQRTNRGYRVRNKLRRISVRPRLSVFRSNKHMAAQVIDDSTGRTLASASTVEKDLRTQGGGNVAAAAAVGKLVAERAIAAGVKQVAFDRREYKYHGRVAALADAARDAGLDLGAKKVVEAKPEAKPKGGDKKKGGDAKGGGGEKKPKEPKEKKKPAEAS
jgi:large subunit ribosomal protein L18